MRQGFVSHAEVRYMWPGSAHRQYISASFELGTSGKILRRCTILSLDYMDPITIYMNGGESIMFNIWTYCTKLMLSVKDLPSNAHVIVAPSVSPCACSHYGSSRASLIHSFVPSNPASHTLRFASFSSSSYYSASVFFATSFSHSP